MQPKKSILRKDISASAARVSNVIFVVTAALPVLAFIALVFLGPIINPQPTGFFTEGPRHWSESLSMYLLIYCLWVVPVVTIGFLLVHILNWFTKRTK